MNDAIVYNPDSEMRKLAFVRDQIDAAYDADLHPLSFFLTYDDRYTDILREWLGEEKFCEQMYELRRGNKYNLVKDIKTQPPKKVYNNEKKDAITLFF